MYVNKVTGLTEYETFDELLNAEIIEFTEDNNNYYILLKPEQQYDNCIWIVNKKTEEVSFMYYTGYICFVMDNVTPVDPKTIKRANKG